MSLWEALLSNICSFLGLSSSDNFDSEQVQKVYHNVEEILKLLKPIISSIVHANVASSDTFTMGMKQLVHSIHEYRSHLENWHPLASRVYFVMQAEALVTEVCADVFKFVHQLKNSCQHLSRGLNLASLELCIQKVNDTRSDTCESASLISEKAITVQARDKEPTLERLLKIAHHLGIKSNQDVLIEIIYLEEKLNNAKQAENIQVSYIKQLIALFTHMHDHFVWLKQSQNHVHIPTEFCCPLSLELMTDPVIVASGITYDRGSIKKWLDLGLTMCPKTRQTLGHIYCIPNYTTKALIFNWCHNKDLELSDLVKPRDNYLPCLHEPFQKLVEDLKRDSIEELQETTAQVLQYAKQNMDYRNLIAVSGGIGPLVKLLRSTDPTIQENAVTTLLYMAINNDYKFAISDANAVKPLIHVLEIGTSVAQENAAATLFCLSMINKNKSQIGRLGAIPALIKLLENGTLRGKKNAVISLFNLSICHENRVRIVNDGAVKLLVALVDNPVGGMVDEVVAILGTLSKVPEGRMAIGQAGGIPVMVDVLELGSAKAKEKAAASLLQLCIYSSRYCKLVVQEGVVPPLVVLSQSGTPGAKNKAQSLLSYLRHGHANASRWY